METVSCIFCNQSSAQIAIEENGYTGRRCTACNLIYISPRPTMGEIANIYGHDASGISAASHIKQSALKRLYARHSLRILTRYKATGSLLEIGAGAGYFLDEARKQGFDVYGIELNGAQAGFMRSQLNIACEQAPLDDASFDGKKFDIIYHCDVLSHFYEPIADLRKIGERLKPGGILVFETGNFADVRKHYFDLIPTFLYPEHLFFFGEQSLHRLLERSGYQLAALKRYSLVPELRVSHSGAMARFLKFAQARLARDRAAAERSQRMSYVEPSTQAPQAPRAAPESRIKRWLKRAYAYGLYFLRYRIGGIAPKQGRPQTLIVVAAPNKLK